MERTDKFLTFGSNNQFYYDYETATDYIAVRPIIEFFGANYYIEVIKIENNDMMGPSLRKFPFLHRPGTNLFRPEYFLPVKFVIGWLMHIDANIEVIKEYYENMYEKNPLQ